MMKRRDFLKSVGLGLAACWSMGRLSWPWTAQAVSPEFRLALLADAHLKSGADRQPTARALARAVSEIRALSPRPDLVLFAGDLAHHGRPDALDLGREILSDLSAPLLLVRGEGDGPPEAGRAWSRRFGAPRFCHSYRGCHLLGLDTVLTPSPSAPVFALGPEQRRWLAGELARLDPAMPLLILSHAPLAQIFRPWRQWTADAAAIYPLLARFRHVLCLHGHAHNAGIRGQGSGIRISTGALASEFPTWTENRKPKTENVFIPLGLPPTSWPRPLALQGTPATPRPGLGPQGCGWVLLSIRNSTLEIVPHLWQG